MNNSRKYKIAVIGLKGLPAFGGAATVGENIIAQLKYKYDFTVFAVNSHTNAGGQQDGYFQVVFNKSPIKKFNILFYYLRAMLYCLFRGNFDLIHLHHSDGAFIIPFLRLRYKVICTSHAQPQVNEKWPSWVKVFFQLNENIMLKFANKITAVSLPLTTIYQTKTKRPIHYVPNGISIEQPVNEEILPYSNYLLFAAGRILPLKGLHILLEALTKLKTDMKLLVIGDLEQVPKYKEKILTLANDIDIVFIDIIKEKSKLLNYVKQAKFFIFPSYSENMSIMLLEAALVKTPIISSDIPANTAIFDDSEVLFFKTNDIEDLANKIRFASDNIDIMDIRSEKAFSKLKQKYLWQEISASYDMHFNSLIKN